MRTDDCSTSGETVREFLTAFLKNESKLVLKPDRVIHTSCLCIIFSSLISCKQISLLTENENQFDVSEKLDSEY